MKSWRLIPLMCECGARQMAIDRWLLEKHRQGKHPPTLRFYTWFPVAISLGYHQRDYPSYWNDLIWEGKDIEVIRRPTGGRGVLHQGDLTYMIVTSGIAGTRAQVYQRICQFLITGWAKLGIALSYGNSQRGYIHNPNCFALATSADLVTSDGQKLIGSAQLRQGNAILQHGSMLLNPNQFLFSQVFGESYVNHINLPFADDNLIELVVDSLIAAAKDCFQVDFFVEPLSDDELRDIKVITLPNQVRTTQSLLPHFSPRD